MLHLHRWTAWEPSHHYVDVSFGGHATSTMLTRRCEKCGLIKSKGLYGVDLPIPPGAPS